jgi:hypothetical protein
MNAEKSKILNQQLRTTYEEFLGYIVVQANPLPEVYIAWCYYLLLQERIDEALQVFRQKLAAREGKAPIVASIQYDYLASYLDFYEGYPNFVRARQLSAKYLQYPVASWRNLFVELANQLTEYDEIDRDGEAAAGEPKVENDPEEQEERLAKNARAAEREE